MTAGELEMLVLAVLRAGPEHGYALLQRLRTGMGSRSGLGESRLYPLLHRLEARGWIAAEWEQMPEGRPPRKVYSLTEPGSAELMRLRSEWAERMARIGGLVGLSFRRSGGAPPSAENDA
jgi:DNA-binding PadR family transcriptional regulator